MSDAPKQPAASSEDEVRLQFSLNGDRPGFELVSEIGSMNGISPDRMQSEQRSLNGSRPQSQSARPVSPPPPPPPK